MSTTTQSPLRFRSHMVKPLASHTHTIIFLHDRGSDATEFALRLFDSHESTTKLSLRDTFPSFKWIFPYAPVSASPKYISFQEIGITQWFDVLDVAHPQERSEEQRPSLNRAVAALLSMVRREITDGGIPAHHIFLAGAGQGMALAAHTLLRLNAPLAGLIGFSSWLPLREQITAIADGDDWDGSLDSIMTVTGTQGDTHADEPQLETPVLLSHSRDDAIVPIDNGTDLRDALQALGMKVEWHEYANGGHWLQEPQGVNDLAAFLRKSIAKHYLMDKRLSRPVVPGELILPDDSLKAVA